MPASTLTMGADAVCTDGVCGDVSRVVVDPIAQVVTHLVIEPKYRRGLGRLVPLDLVDTTTEAVRLRCTLSDFDRLEIAEETQFLPGSMGYANYGPGQSLAWPYYGLGSAFVGDDVGFGVGNVAPPVTIDVLPAGEVAVRRGEHVHATDAHRQSARSRDRPSQSPRDPCTPPRGTSLGPQRGRDPHRRGAVGRRRHPPQPHQATSTRPPRH